MLIDKCSSRPRHATWASLAFLTGAALLLLVVAYAPRVALADESVESLNTLIQSLDSFQADFEQTLYGGNNEALKSTTGSIKLKRPGRFVWSYDAPEPQVIVADGERIWLYDVDLEQVTVNAIDDRIAGTPLQLLMTDASIEDSFSVTALGESDGINWFELQPIEQQSDFELVFIGVKDNGIAAMELRDNFGQATQIQFIGFSSDVRFADSEFVFEVPDGVDLIGLDEQ